MKKKLQIFISSTYLDLQEEREAAVEAVLGSKHIPAGMELFRAGNKSQLETIKKWIDESDIYMLILGGRYGSIEPESRKSYTQLEYEYALKKGIPIFAVVLKDEFLYKKAANQGNDVIKDISNPEFQKFKELVMSKMIKEVEDCKDIKIAIKDSIVELDEEYDLVGWVRAIEMEKSDEILKENLQLSKEIADLTKKNIKIESELIKIKSINKLKTKEFEVIRKKLLSENVKLKENDDDDEIELNCLEAFEKYNKYYALGIDNRDGMTVLEKYLYARLAPKCIGLGLLEIKKVKGYIRIIELSKDGKEFLKYLAKKDIDLN